MATCASLNTDEGKLLICVEHLLRFGARVNVFDKFLTTPLIYASKQGRSKLVKALIDHGVDLNAQDNNGLTVS